MKALVYTQPGELQLQERPQPPLQPGEVVLLNGKGVDPRYEATAPKLEGNPKLSALQATNLQINLQLMRLEKARVAAATSADDDGLEDILYEGN